MADQNKGLIKKYSAGATIAPYRIVKFSAAKTVIQAAAATDKLWGVSDIVGYDPANTNNRYPVAELDVILTGIAPVLYGGTVAFGDQLTSDATGRAVTAAPAAGTNNRIIGIAQEDGVVGDIGSVLIVQGSFQG